MAGPAPPPSVVVVVVVVVVGVVVEVVVVDEELVVLDELVVGVLVVVVDELVDVVLLAQSIWAWLRTLLAAEVKLPLRPESTEEGRPVTRSCTCAAASEAAGQSPAATAASTLFSAELRLLA
mgnify:CR=1 FL=1